MRSWPQRPGFYRTKAQERTWKTCKDWQAFWKVEKDPGIEGTPRFAGGDLLARLEIDPVSLTSADFHLEKGSAGPEGKDLGADVDSIGPGAAYEKWQNTPEYQDWRRKTKELMTNSAKSTNQVDLIEGSQSKSI